MQQCLHAVAPDSELQAKLIGMGLAETDASARAEAQADSSPSITTEHQAQQVTEPDSQPDTESHSAHGQNSASSMEEQKHAKAEFATGDGGKGSTEGSVECNSAAACQWRVLRLSLLRHKARLQTNMDIHHGYAPAEEVIPCSEDIGSHSLLQFKHCHVSIDSKAVYALAGHSILQSSGHSGTAALRKRQQPMQQKSGSWLWRSC